MDAPSTHERLLGRLVEAGAIQVRTRADAPPFWYTSNQPGPFYINVERLAGPHVPETLLAINGILRDHPDAAERSRRIRDRILSAWRGDEGYRETVALLADTARRLLPRPPRVISGGERRDWFFSIPLAEALEARHLYLYKNGTWHGEDIAEGSDVVHVSDIVNTGSSYFRHWLPTLERAGFRCDATFTVAVRSQIGQRALEERGIRVVTPLRMDETVFRQAAGAGLIPPFALEDVLQYFASPRAWTQRLLDTCGPILLAAAADMDPVARGRLEAFVETDPLGLREECPDFFERARRT
ncbi:hypothetical protein, partial [Alicyclobacillus sp.]|uniref:hypothetical protein n=1 Tax=Alicyclobacillus sp. TaxID=61169 RepID=UPI0025BFB949